jgi:DNA-binding transcriptional ArsR family regulator
MRRCRCARRIGYDGAMPSISESVVRPGSGYSPWKEADIEQASATLRALGHPLRLKILCLLEHRERRVQEIVETVGTTQSNVSQHLGVLRECGVLAARHEANRVYYRIERAGVPGLIALVRDQFCTR